MTVKELKSAIEALPDDMLVAIYEQATEASGHASSVWVCNDRSECPYDKGYDIYAVAENKRCRGRPSLIASDKTKVCFIQS